MIRSLLLVPLVACSFQAGSLSRSTDASTSDGDPSDGVSLDGAAPTPDAAPTPAPFALTGHRWQLACLDNLGNFNCHCPVPQTTMVTLTGDSTRWNVTVRIRGIMEAITYNGGSAGTSGWYVGGNPGDGANNVYRLTVSSPSQTYWINRGTPTGQRSFLYDYQETLQIDGNATVTFFASGQDTLQWGNYDGNGTAMTINGLAGITQPYDGQFAHIEVVSATL